MAKLAGKQTSPTVPLDEADWKLLADLFEPLELEELRQIERVATSLLVAPLEAWEEAGWLIGSEETPIST